MPRQPLYVSRSSMHPGFKIRTAHSAAAACPLAAWHSHAVVGHGACCPQADEIESFFQRNPLPNNTRAISQMLEAMRSNAKFIEAAQGDILAALGAITASSK